MHFLSWSSCYYQVHISSRPFLFILIRNNWIQSCSMPSQSAIGFSVHFRWRDLLLPVPNGYSPTGKQCVWFLTTQAKRACESDTTYPALLMFPISETCKILTCNGWSVLDLLLCSHVVWASGFVFKEKAQISRRVLGNPFTREGQECFSSPGCQLRRLFLSRNRTQFSCTIS